MTVEPAGADLDYLTLATRLQQEGDIGAAAMVLRHGQAAALRGSGPFSAQAAGTYARVSAELTNLLARSGAPADALRVAAELRNRLRELGYPGSELLILANLIEVHRALGDLAAAGESAVAAARLWADGGRQALPDFPAPDAPALGGTITGVANAAYYSAEDYALAAAMAELAIGLDPDSAEAFRLLAFSRYRLKQFDSADVAFDQAIRLEPEPSSRAGLHTGKAAALQGARRLDEAVASITQAITLIPGKPHYFMTRGQLNSDAGNRAQAIADFDQAIKLAAQAAARETGERREFRSQADYRRDMPAADVQDIASMFRMNELWKAGRTKDALQAAGALAAHGHDPATRAEGQCRLSAWYLELGELEPAARAFTAAIDAGIFLARALLGRARCRAGLGLVDDALADLEALCGQDPDRHDPKGAAALLSRLLEQHPELTRARLVIGHALLEAWRPTEAIQELDKVLDEEPGNWQALRWRGMSRVTHGGPGEGTREASDDDAWNSGLSFERIWEALEDLVAAATAAPEGTPLPELTWLVERALLIEEIEARLVEMASLRVGLGDALAEAVPALRSAFRRFEAVVGAIAGQDWAAAVGALAEYRAEAAAAGLHILAAKADLLTADVLLRQFELQRALDHLATAELVLPTIGHPPGWLSSHVGAVASTDAAWYGGPGQEQDSAPVINLDMDHLEFSTLVVFRFVRFSRLIKAAAAARLGRPREALRDIVDLTSIFEGAAAGENTSYALGVVPILRDSGEYSQALALIDALAPHVLDDPFERERLTGYQASTYRLMGRPERAEEILEAEVARARAGKLERPHVAAANLASALIGRDDGQALSLLDEFPPHEAESVAGLSNWHIIRGQALLGLERYREALAEFTTGLGLRDQVRGSLRAEDARISWQAERLDFIGLAVLAALGAGETERALELAEAGKARAFIDQLELAHPQVTPEAAEIAAAIDQAQQRRQLLRRLIGALSPGQQATTPEELAITLRELSALGIDLRRDAPVTVERASRLLHYAGAQVQNLEARFQEASSRGRESVAGTVVTAPALRDLLASSGNTAGRVLLAEYFIVGETIIVFLVGSGGIEAVLLEMSEPVVQAAAQSWLAAVSRGRTPDASGPDSLDTLGPLIEPVLDACAPGDVICFVPHGIMHYLPLHALPAGGTRLVERNPVVYAPSASVLAQCRARRGDQPRQWRSALVLGDSEENLPHAREEARTVADLLGVPAFVGEAAVKPLLSALREPRADGPDVVHLACHGVFDADQPLRSGIVLAPRPGGHPDDAILTAEEVYGLRLTAGLVTLSACDSGQSVSAPGEELLGLTRAFIAAGATTLLVSLWPVDDLSTGLLMEAFYTRLIGADGRPAAPPADALRHAQTRLMTLTAGEAVGLVRDRIARTTDSLDLLYRKLDLARLRIVAGDLPAAEAVYAEVKHELAGRPGPLADLVDQRLRLIRFKQEAATPVDYDVRPFGHPRYWSAFALVGDWR